MDMGSYLQFVFALVIVLGLIALLTVIIKRSGFMPTAALRKGGERRLRILEFAQLSTKHRLVLIRRDETEHLILMGPDHSLLVESGITSSPNRESFAQMVEETSKGEPVQ